jgi:hypothetical protein
MDGTPIVDSLVDMTTLDSDPKGDPTVEKKNLGGFGPFQWFEEPSQPSIQGFQADN